MPGRMHLVDDLIRIAFDGEYGVTYPLVISLAAKDGALGARLEGASGKLLGR